ncbi:MAG: YkuS family protein [Firmicutes bacterium]|nr:YkuS family protein [Bacillota bacterium]MCL5040531.1 YkuS family protein [Bacillota bacterium]
MKKVIAIEDNLSPFERALRKEGYEVKTIKEGWREADAIIVSGQDDNLLGIQEIQTRAPVISAEGRTPEEVLVDLKKRLS